MYPLPSALSALFCTYSSYSVAGFFSVFSFLPVFGYLVDAIPFFADEIFLRLRNKFYPEIRIR